MSVHYYGHEIIPISPTEVKMRSVMLIDPQMDAIPESIVNWVTRQFSTFMYSKLLKYSKSFKGTKYEQRLKESNSKDFYGFIEQILITHFEEKGWPKFDARLWLLLFNDYNIYY